MNNKKTTNDILKSVFVSGDTLNLAEYPKTSSDIIKVVYSEDDNALRVNVQNLPSGGLEFYRETITVEGLEIATATYSGKPAGCSTTITLSAVVPGAAGNMINFEFDGASTIDDKIGFWNAAYPANTVILTSEPATGGQIPDTKNNIKLSGGVDAGAAPAFLVITHNLDALMIRVSMHKIDGDNKTTFYFLTTSFISEVKDNTSTCSFKYTESLPNSVKIYLQGNFVVGLDYTFIIEKLY